MKQSSTLWMLLAQVVSIVGFATYPSALVQIKQEWALSNFQAGTIASSFFLGYVAVVSMATSLTDRIDARRIYILGAFASSLGSACMAFLANSFSGALISVMLTGAGVSATYMPGLKILSDRVERGQLTRHISFYTAFFGVGTALSYFSSGLMIELYGWRSAFMVAAIGPLLAGTIVCFVLKALPNDLGWLDLKLSLSDVFPVKRWKQVMKTQDAFSYMLGYAVHSLELFATRSWMVTYFIFCAKNSGQDHFFPVAASLLVAIINLAGVPASIIGNEIALKIGRRQWITTTMLVSAGLGFLAGFMPGFPWYIIVLVMLVYNLFVMADSATLTAGLVISVPQEIKGVALGLHSLMGFGGGLLGPALFGAALDVSSIPLWPLPTWLFSFTTIILFSILFALLQPFKNRRQHEYL